jgi:SRSO17 transposase
MTEADVARIGMLFPVFLRRFSCCFGDRRAFANFVRYCRGLLGSMPRKCVEPMAMASGAGVRSLQWFLSRGRWNRERLRDMIQQRVAEDHLPSPGSLPRGEIGPVGLIDETSDDKKGNKTPGVQRQYLGCVGKTDNGIVTVHLAMADGRFKTLLDSDLFLPESWDSDRDRCREAGIPDDVHHRPKTQMALDQVRHALGNGVRFSFLTFDEGYGKCPAFLFGLDALGQHYVGEIPRNFRCFGARPRYHSLQKAFQTKKVQNICRFSPLFRQQRWRKVTLERQTLGPQEWQVKAAQVYLRDREGRPTDRTYWLILAWQRDSNEYKYFISNAPASTSLLTLLKVAFTRWNVEHGFRMAKSEIGFMDYEGRRYEGLMRHLTLCMLVMLFVAEQTEAMRSFSPSSDPGADHLRTQRPMPEVVGSTAT